MTYQSQRVESLGETLLLEQRAKLENLGILSLGGISGMASLRARGNGWEIVIVVLRVELQLGARRRRGSHVGRDKRKGWRRSGEEGTNFDLGTLVAARRGVGEAMGGFRGGEKRRTGTRAKTVWGKKWSVRAGRRQVGLPAGHGDTS
jgi:hypothetical protein